MLTVRLVSCALLAATLAAPAAAESWYYVGDSKSSIVFADADSLSRNGDVAKFVAFYGADEPLDNNGTDIYYWKNSQEVDCAGKRIRIVDSDNFDENRKYLSSDGEVTEWTPIDDGTIADSLRAFACDGKREDQVSDPFDESDEFWDSESSDS